MTEILEQPRVKDLFPSLRDRVGFWVVSTKGVFYSAIFDLRGEQPPSWVHHGAEDYALQHASPRTLEAAIALNVITDKVNKRNQGE